MGKSFSIIGIVIILIACSFTQAHALKNDFALWSFCVRDAKGDCVNEASNDTKFQPDNDKFYNFSKQLSAVFAPKFHAPAETLGWLGWNLGLEFTINDIPGGEQWDDALEGVERFPALDASNSKARSAPGLLNTIQLHARKGLPFSTELGFTATYLINSKMVMLGVEGKFAFVEGFTYVPDMAVRMNYNHLFGSPDLDLDIWGWDLSISKNFGVGSFIQLAPYTGYSLIYSIVSPMVLNPSFDKNNNDRLLMLDKQTHVIHRWFLGVRMIASYFSFTPEIVITSAKVYSYSFNIGAEF